MKKYAEHILNKCPICGSKLQYNAYYQYSNIYSIKRNGELSDTRVRKIDNGSLESGFIFCTNSKCNFVTDVDFGCSKHPNICIFQEGAVYKYIDSNEEAIEC